MLCASPSTGYAINWNIWAQPEVSKEGEREEQRKYMGAKSVEENGCPGTCGLWRTQCQRPLLPSNQNLLCVRPCARYFTDTVTFNFLSHATSSFIYWPKQVTHPVQVQGVEKYTHTLSWWEELWGVTVGAWIKGGTMLAITLQQSLPYKECRSPVS